MLGTGVVGDRVVGAMECRRRRRGSRCGGVSVEGAYALGSGVIGDRVEGTSVVGAGGNRACAAGGWG